MGTHEKRGVLDTSYFAVDFKVPVVGNKAVDNLLLQE